MDDKRFDRWARRIGEESDVSRRILLGGAGSAFALALSSLLSLRTIDEAVARGAADGALGGRHGKNRRGRNKRKHRKNNGKGKNGKPPGSGGSPTACNFADVRVIVENQTASPIDFEGWYQRTDAQRFCQKTAQQTIQPSETPLYDPQTCTAYAWVNKSEIFLFESRDPELGFPMVSTFSDTTMTRQKCQQNNGNSVNTSKELGVGQTYPITINGKHYEIVRDGDAGGVVVFRLKALP